MGLIASILKAVAVLIGFVTRQVERRQHRQDGANEAAIEAERRADQLVHETREHLDQIEVTPDRIMSDPNNRLRRK